MNHPNAMLVKHAINQLVRLEQDSKAIEAADPQILTNLLDQIRSHVQWVKQYPATTPKE